MTGEFQDDNVGGDIPEDQRKKEGGDDTDGSSESIRESMFEGEYSSEYIKGAVLEASEAEEELARSPETGDVSRFQLWIGERLSNSKIPEILYSLNPMRYDRLDWVFAFSFCLVIAGTFVIFWTDSFLIGTASLVVMFVSFCVMLLCAGMQDLVKDKFREIRTKYADNEEEEEAFEEGEKFENEDKIR